MSSEGTAEAVPICASCGRASPVLQAVATGRSADGALDSVCSICFNLEETFRFFTSGELLEGDRRVLEDITAQLYCFARGAAERAVAARNCLVSAAASEVAEE